MLADDGARPKEPVRANFIAAYTLAQIAAFVSFQPLLQVLLPLKAEAIDPGGKAIVLAQVAFYGAIAASIANLLAGAISDRTPLDSGGVVRGWWSGLSAPRWPIWRSCTPRRRWR